MVLARGELWQLPHAGLFIGGALTILALSIIVANWLKIIFILNLSYLYKIDRLAMSPTDRETPAPIQDFWQRQRRWFKQARNSLVSTIALSVITMALTLMISASLVAPLLWQAGPVGLRSGLGVLAALLFVIVVFFSSCLNIFASFSVVLYEKNVFEALAIAWTMIWAKFKALVVLSAALVGIYLVGLALGLAGAGLIHHAYNVLLSAFIQLRWQSIAGVLYAYHGLGTTVFWLWFGIINALFNTALFGFFIANIRPHKLGEEDPALAHKPMPAPALNSVMEAVDREPKIL